MIYSDKKVQKVANTPGVFAGDGKQVKNSCCCIALLLIFNTLKLAIQH